MQAYRRIWRTGVAALAAGMLAGGPAAAGPAAAVYEMRTYYPAPGKFEALNARFRNHTLKLFEKHGMTNVAYWAQEDVPGGRLIYILAYPDRPAREAAWQAFRADPEWQAVARASEVDGRLVEKVESIFLQLTDYSPPLTPAASAGK